MQRLEVSCTVRRIYTSLGAKGLKTFVINNITEGKDLTDVYVDGCFTKIEY